MLFSLFFLFCWINLGYAPCFFYYYYFLRCLRRFEKTTTTTTIVLRLLLSPLLLLIFFHSLADHNQHTHTHTEPCNLHNILQLIFARFFLAQLYFECCCCDYGLSAKYIVDLYIEKQASEHIMVFLHRLSGISVRFCVSKKLCALNKNIIAINGSTIEWNFTPIATEKRKFPSVSPVSLLPGAVTVCSLTIWMLICVPVEVSFFLLEFFASSIKEIYSYCKHESIEMTLSQRKLFLKLLELCCRSRCSRTPHVSVSFLRAWFMHLNLQK